MGYIRAGARYGHLGQAAKTSRQIFTAPNYVDLLTTLKRFYGEQGYYAGVPFTTMGMIVRLSSYFSDRLDKGPREKGKWHGERVATAQRNFRAATVPIYRVALDEIQIKGNAGIQTVIGEDTAAAFWDALLQASTALDSWGVKVKPFDTAQPLRRKKKPKKPKTDWGKAVLFLAAMWLLSKA